MWNTAAQRADMHDRLVRSAHAANVEGAVMQAASLFHQASQIEPRPATVISHVNMLFKAGNYALAASCYSRLLLEYQLSDKQQEMVQAKRQQANAAAARDLRCAGASVVIIAAFRRLKLRQKVVHASAANVLQRCVLRWLHRHGRGPLPLVEHVTVLNTGGEEDNNTSAILFHCECADPRTVKLGLFTLLPFCEMAGGEMTGGRQADEASSADHEFPLQFCLTTKIGERIHGCVLKLWKSRCCYLVLLGRHYTPRAFAGAAQALLPVAASSLAGWESYDCDVDIAMGRKTSHTRDALWDPLRKACLPLVTVCGPRATGAMWQISVDKTILRGRLPPIRAIDIRAESPEIALAPSVGKLRSATLARLLSALLLEQKVVLSSASAFRLSRAAHACISLLLPLRWTQTYVPLLPASHHVVLNAPFPFIYGILTSNACDVSPGIVVFDIDCGSICGEVLETLPRREQDILRRIRRQPPQRIAHGFDATAQACFAVVMSILRDVLTLAPDAWAASPMEGEERLDVALDLLSERFVLSRAAGDTRAFVRLLCETSSFKEFAEHVLRPRENWPRWLRSFMHYATGGSHGKYSGFT